jgi:hypothetical protein
MFCYPENIESEANKLFAKHGLVRGETGLLEVFSLVPNDVSLPRFRARIDDGNPGRRRDKELDIDIAGVSDKIKRDFNAKRNDYAGHHNDRSPSREQRVFEVKIVMPVGVVFDGDVSFSAHLTVLLEAGASSTVGIETNVIRAGKNNPTSE